MFIALVIITILLLLGAYREYRSAISKGDGGLGDAFVMYACLFCVLVMWSGYAVYKFFLS